MASGFSHDGILQIFNGGVDFDTDTLKLALMDDSFVFDHDDQFFDNGGDDVNDPSEHELVATNYTGGFGGAGRKTVSVTVSNDKTNNRVIGVLGDLTWSALGGASNDTIGGALLIKEGTSDLDTLVLGFLDLTNTPTNGSDITLDFNDLAAGGNVRINI